MILDPAPTAVVASPDGQRIYIRHDPTTKSLSSINTVSVIETTGSTIVASIPVGTASAGDVSISPDGSRLYVTNNVDFTLSVIDTGTNTVIHTIAAGYLGSSHGVAVSPDGSELYVTDFNQPGSTFVVDTTSYAVAPTPIATGAGSEKSSSRPMACGHG